MPPSLEIFHNFPDTISLTAINQAFFVSLCSTLDYFLKKAKETSSRALATSTYVTT